MKASVIVATYNNPRFLRLTLAGYQRQTIRDFEVLIADDGSGPEIRELVEEVSGRVQFAVRHVWQEDQGWRKNRILNQCVRASRSDYLVFADQDCIPHSRFVAEHLGNRSGGVFLAGRRVSLQQKISDRLTEDSVRKGYLEKAWTAMLFQTTIGQVKHWEDAVWVPPILRKVTRRRYGSLLGCNFSVHKTDLYRINGFDERYQDPAIGEDVDISYRFSLLGIKGKSVRNRAIQYHLYHESLLRRQVNYDLFDKVQRQRKPMCNHGLRNLEGPQNPRRK